MRRRRRAPPGGDEHLATAPSCSPAGRWSTDRVRTMLRSTALTPSAAGVLAPGRRAGRCWPRNPGGGPTDPQRQYQEQRLDEECGHCDRLRPVAHIVGVAGQADTATEDETDEWADGHRDREQPARSLPTTEQQHHAGHASHLEGPVAVAHVRRIPELSQPTLV